MNGDKGTIGRLNRKRRKRNESDERKQWRWRKEDEKKLAEGD
jgi:hypothetical protein